MIRHIQMVDDYRPSPIQAAIASWRARGAVDASASWRGLAGGGFHEETLDCAHHAILLSPAVIRVAASLDAALFDVDRIAVADEAAESGGSTHPVDL
jgi:hypothetical protein